MASSEKAGALKDAFVNAIADELGGEAMAQAGAMENAKLAGKLGLDVGNQATTFYDLPYGNVIYVNDGEPNVKGRDFNHKYFELPDQDRVKYPLKGEKFGAERVVPLTDPEKREVMDHVINNSTFRMDAPGEDRGPIRAR